MLLAMSLQCQPMTNNGENGQCVADSPADRAAFFRNINVVHIAFAISPKAIVPRITCCTTRCSLVHPTDFLWKSENLIKTSTIWLFVRGSSLFFPASGTLGDESSAFIIPSWISSGLRNADACTNLVATSPYFELFTKSRFNSHVVWTERRLRESRFLEGFAWLSLKSCKRSSL